MRLGAHMGSLAEELRVGPPNAGCLRSLTSCQHKLGRARAARDQPIAPLTAEALRWGLSQQSGDSSGSLRSLPRSGLRHRLACCA